MKYVIAIIIALVVQYVFIFFFGDILSEGSIFLVGVVLGAAAFHIADS